MLTTGEEASSLLLAALVRCVVDTVASPAVLVTRPVPPQPLPIAVVVLLAIEHD